MAEIALRAEAAPDLPVVVTPEVLLRNVNETLLKLADALAFLDIDELGIECNDILQRTSVIESMMERYMVAIAGPQGAGKTTLVRTLYDLDETWLVDNPGRGERSPVYVLEYPSVRKPEGWLAEMVDHDGKRSVVSRRAEPDEWRKVVARRAPGVIRIELRVPRRFFPKAPAGAAGMLLLPGYELLRSDNRDWQALMRGAMAAASAVIVVMTKTTLASGATNDILDDLKKRYMAGSTPLVAITHCEEIAHDGKAQEKLREVAAEYFGLTGTDGIFCTGLAPDQRKPDLPLGEIDRRVDRRIQLREIDEINRQQLRPLLRRIEQILQSHQAASGTDEHSRQKCIAEFEDARADLRRNFESRLRQCIDEVKATAQAQAKELGKDQVAGARPAKERVVNWVKLQADKNQSKLEELTLKAWRPDAGRPSPVDLAMPKILAAATQEQLHLKGLNLLQWGGPRERVGALAKAGDPDLRLSGHAVNDLRILTGQATEGNSQELSVEFISSVRLVPALSLSWAMVAAAVPELVAHDMVTGGEASPESIMAAARAFDGLSEEWHAGIQLMVNTVVPIGGLAASKQGQALLAAAIHGSAAATVALSFLGAAAAVGAAALVIQVTNSNNRARMSAINQAIYGLAEREYAARMKGFDDLMDMASEILNGRLRRIYQTDETAGRRDRLARLVRLARYQSDDLLAASRANMQSLV